MADPTPVSNERTTAIPGTQASGVAEEKSKESVVKASLEQNTNSVKSQPEPVVEQHAENVQPAPLKQDLVVVAKPQSAPVMEKQPEVVHPVAVKQDLPAAKIQPQVVAMLQNAEPPVPVTTPAPTPVAVQAPGANPVSPISLPVQTVTGQVISAPAPTVVPKYSGDLISLELKDADLKDFFRLIGEISGLNIVLDPDVKGSLTIFLNDVPWDQALDVVLKNNGLGKQLDGNVLRIAANNVT